ncbi:MAG: hypothetical protein A2V92_00525 [Candidatus Muproteobacteria bacterium RBG_16_65_31]|uniref:Chemotaxis protein CheA n=1 Tax=Candidatus Muproteobacteria bacterium RBG_16_65_31 TaxID=1817759 RepID=A0A1F6TH57_9PROT|nr:MAG: hypothetical protein A2V92_00525 [Candidatus Muproteobacteria bacterium RBG_16_65_31]
MSTHTKVDLSTLGWVVTEIEETLKQARLALESFAENPSDKTRLRFCITHLHQVVGTLTMVELDGAALIAKETEALAEAVLNDKAEANSAVIEALIRGLLTLPDHLARLQFGQPDSPLKYLPLLNELRAAHGEEPLAEAELFMPDLSVRPPARDRAKARLSDAEYGALAKQQRASFQAALLEWLRDSAGKSPLQAIARVFEQLQAEANQGALEQLFWVAGGLVEALSDGGLEPSPECKKLFARLDQQIKRLIDGAERSLLRSSSEALIRSILLHVGQAQSAGPKITQLKQAFNLETLLSTAAAGAAEETADADLPTPEVLQSVATALAKEIETAQDLLTAYFDPEQKGAASLDPLLEILHRIAGTLDMLGVPLLKELVDELSEVARAVADGRVADSDAASMAMAQALLLIESSARDIAHSAKDWKRQIQNVGARLRGLHTAEGGPAVEGIEVSEAELTETEYKQLLGAVSGEIGVNLGKIEEALEAFVASPAKVEALDEIPQHLSQIQGALQILGLDAASELAEVAKRNIEGLRQRALAADSRLLDALAVGIGTIGAYVEGLRAGRKNTDLLIDSAIQGMNAAATPASQRAPERVSAPPPAATPAVSAPRPAVVKEDVDPEILEIFIEDARDVLQNIQRELRVWREDKDNKNALAELRRGYHTLKGSGRMVGASEISELAWAVENVLTRLRDGKIAFSDEIVDLLDRTEQALPHLINRLAGAPAEPQDTETLRRIGEALASGGAAPTGAAASGELPRLDRTLLEIFTNEANGHLAAIRREIAACRAAGGVCLVTDMLFRATHTLAGNARSLGLHMMSEACTEVEKLLHALKAHELPLKEAQLDLLARLEAVIAELVRALNNGGSAPGLGRQFAAITSEARAASAPLPAADTVKREERSAPAAAPPAYRPPPPAAPAARRPPPAAAPPRREIAAPEPLADDLVREKLDADLFEVFQDEAADILNAIEAALAGWRASPGDAAKVQELKRALHTLKGGALMARAMTMGNLAHNTEGLLKHVEDSAVAPSDRLYDLLEEAHDALVTMLDQLRAGRPVASAEGLNTKIVAMSGSAASAPAAARPAAPDESGAGHAAFGGHAGDRREGQEAEGEGWQARERRGQIRVNTKLLNELVNYAGEVSISRARMEQQIYGFRDNLTELTRNVTRFRDQIRELEIQSESQILYRVEQQSAVDPASGFDPLEFDRYSKLQQLSRGLAESLHDLSTIQINLGNFVGEAQTALLQQARINTELQEGLMRTRMISFSTQAARLRRITRQTGRELGKRVELSIVGADVEVDRNVLERMIGPFEHMIRNALDHGVEPEAERLRAGKSAAGRITIDASQEGNEIVIRFSDDGAGLNIEAIRAKAVERGLVSPEANLTEEELIQFILMSGFSTASQVTHVSGRGVGMDVVHNEVKQLGGTMSVNTKRGEGTTFVIRLPLTLSITQALMVYVGDQMFAVSLSSVANIVEFPIEKLTSLAVGKNPLLNYNDQVYPYMSLGARLGIASQEGKDRKVPVLLTRAGTREVAMHVDGLGGTREIVIKALSPQLTEIKGLAGATIMGDGRVVLILDVAGLWYTDEAMHFERRAVGRVEEKKESQTRPVIMVVDDSLTVRKITGKHLQKRGLDVLTAKDGLDAVEQLRERVPDLMLVDIEMPRMDGYELTARVRSEARLKHIPIIMITSRAGAKHRQKAFEVGVDMYMSKPYQEDELFKNIDDLLARSRQQLH